MPDCNSAPPTGAAYFLLCGSTAEHSHTRALLARLAAHLGPGSAFEIWDLRSRPLPIADPGHHSRPDIHPEAVVREFVTKVDAAKAIALASPLYHGSYSGVLKNAIDHLRWDALRDKPVALLSHGAGVSRCAQPAEHLMSVVRTLYGMAIQTQVCTSRSDFDHGPNGPFVSSAEIDARLVRQVEEISRLLTFADRRPGDLVSAR